MTTTFYDLKKQALVGHPGWLSGETQEVARPLTAAELLEHGFLAVIDEPPAPVNPLRNVVRQNPVLEWLFNDASVVVTYRVEERDIEGIRAELKTAVDRRMAEALDAGYPIPGAGGLRSSLTDVARTDLNGLASIAMLVMSGALPAWLPRLKGGSPSKMFGILSRRRRLPSPSRPVWLAHTASSASTPGA